jgi:hypothetical protein
VTIVFKTGHDKTREEILKESAEVLGRAGERLSAALRELERIEKVIEGKAESLKGLSGGAMHGRGLEDMKRLAHLQNAITGEINSEIRRYNRARDYAKLRYYYLIVIREAVGFRRHKTVEELYRIPPKKESI